MSDEQPTTFRMKAGEKYEIVLAGDLPEAESWRLKFVGTCHVPAFGGLLESNLWWQFETVLAPPGAVIKPVAINPVHVTSITPVISPCEEDDDGQ